MTVQSVVSGEALVLDVDGHRSVFPVGQHGVPHMCTVAANLMLTACDDADGQLSDGEGQHELLHNLHLNRKRIENESFLKAFLAKPWSTQACPDRLTASQARPWREKALRYTLDS